MIVFGDTNDGGKAPQARLKHKKMHYSPFEAHDSPLTPCLLPTVFCENAGEWVICNLNRGNGVSV